MKEEVFAASRQQRIGSQDAVEAVVLETHGSYTVIERAEGTSTATLQDLSGHDRDPMSEDG